MKKILKFMILTAVIISLTACKKEIGTEENTETSIKTVGTRVCHFIQYIIIKFFLILQGFPCFFNTHMI